MEEIKEPLCTDDESTVDLQSNFGAQFGSALSYQEYMYEQILISNPTRGHIPQKDTHTEI